MSNSIIAEFKIPYVQYLNEKSTLTQKLPKFADEKTLQFLYYQMHLARALDEKAINLQRTGRMGTYPATIGQEAIGAGIGYALKKDDVFCPYYRDQPILLQHSMSAKDILTLWGGDERGNDYSKGSDDMPICVPIATQCLHAAGIAYAIKYRKQKRAVLVTLGDGATSKGDFYETVNLAGAWDLPLVIVINNNQWAISVSRKAQSHCKTLAQKAIAGGLEATQIDGNDIIAVHETVANALEKARQGKGASVIEMMTYRLCDHTTADDASRYQPEKDVQHAWDIEPINRLRKYLESINTWSEQQENELKLKVTAEIDQAVEEYFATAKQSNTSIMDYLYETLPEALLDQYDEIRGLS
ncbi:MAG: pyruvate dehydrogenase (acetyl-transferring) E1 component subunit alpha [Gammaproteobacteria bacterium]|nr:pyruvate dehydrogenase (acetyl-transferring) E1 component subunit alpha [Gammaproteobacteria bacterium]